MILNGIQEKNELVYKTSGPLKITNFISQPNILLVISLVYSV